MALSYLTKLEEPKHLKENTLGKYKSINLNRVDNLINDITIGDNIVDLGDNTNIYFRDFLNFLSGIKNNVINNFNKEKEYKRRLMNTEDKLINRKKNSTNINLYIKYLNNLKNILFSNKKSSGEGLNISSLPILLSKLNIKNSRELINDIEQLINIYTTINK